jgi:hypothetical protein
MTGNPALCKESPADILDFWLAAGPDWWFEKDDEFDAQIRALFQSTYEVTAELPSTLGGVARRSTRSDHRVRPAPAKHLPRECLLLYGRPARLRDRKARDC